MESIITAFVAGGLSLIGVIISNLSANKKIETQLSTNQAVVNTKIDMLTEEVKKHNSFGDRITRMEVRLDNLEKGGR
ncbi:MAG: hypothetical protein J6Y60_10375 [Treponema sp.]|nr:hypothetical protein [Treponema sp.]